MYQDYKDLLSAFQSHGVKYLVVGGFAVIYHSQPRFTKDLDLFIKSDSANTKATYAALAEFGAPLHDIHPDDFTDRNNFFRFGRERRNRRPEYREEYRSPSGRPQDLADADAVRQAQRLRPMKKMTSQEPNGLTQQ